MPLCSLETYQFRNLQSGKIELDSGLQVVYGDNASGKSSLLDAMHVLCSAKSFLGAAPRKLQQFNYHEFSVIGEVIQRDYPRLKLQYRWQESQIRLMQGLQTIRRTSEYAVLQPVQAITPLSYRLIDDSPDIRRRFIDWGVFHVKHEYIDIWRRFQRALSQRNAMLIQGVDDRTLSAWSNEYVQLSHEVHEFRLAYINILDSIVNKMITRFLPSVQVSMKYQRGWDADKDLGEILRTHYKQDRERHFTYYGPQRAELTIRLDNKLARDVASRGQKKLITFAMYLAQASLLQEMGNNSGLLLVDDLPSELDADHQSVVIEILQELPMQVVISCIDQQQLELSEGIANKLFHVKHGEIKEV
jgi:DNA replication and repair protein RecF